MSREIEQRIVEMRFDNAQFEAGTKQTLSTLDKLKQKLKFDDVSDSFSKISASAAKVDMKSMSDSVETTRLKFSALEAVAVGALMRIGSTLTDVATKALKTFTLDPITNGFSEYELKMGSVQTIMAGTGASIEEVNGYLDELNAYSDRTIYSFSDMTNNIGKFTNAGVKLDVAVNAMKGISNLAALSGANTQQASSAMYNFSQALSAGYMGLVDWNSIANTAGIGTESFKQVLIDTAVEMGTLKEVEGGYVSTTTNLQGKTSDLLTTSKGFTASLQHQWMTADVLTAALSKYSDETTDLGKSAYAAAQDVKTFSGMMDALKEAAGSGWATTWEILIGDLEQAKAFWTPINNTLSDIITKINKSRNDLLQGWVDAGGRSALIEGLAGFFSGIGEIAGSIRKAFDNIIPDFTSEHLKKITDGFVNLLNCLRPTEGVLKGIQKAFETLFGAAKTGFEILKLPLTFLPVLQSLFAKLGEGLSILAPSFSKVGDSIHKFLTSNDGVAKIIQNVSDMLSSAADSAANFIDNISLDSLQSFTDSLTSGFSTMIDKLKIVKTSIKETFDVSGIVNGVTSMFGKIGDTLRAIPWDSVIKGGIGIAGAFTIWKNITRFKDVIESFTNTVKSMSVTNVINNVSESVTSAINNISESLQIFQKGQDTNKWVDLGTGIALVAGSLLLLSMLDREKIASSLTAIGLIISGMSAAIFFSNKFGGFGATKGIIGFSASILLIATSVKRLADIPSESLTKATVAVTALIGVMTAFSLLSSNFGGVKKVNITPLIGMATSMVILVQAVKPLAKLDMGGLIKGISGVSILIVELVAAIKILGSIKSISLRNMAGLLTISTSIVILAQTLKQISGISWEGIAKGLVGIAGVMTEIIVISKIIGKTNTNLLSVGANMMVMALGLTAMCAPLKILSGMSWEGIGKGLSGLAGLLLEIIAFTKLVPDKNFSKTAVQMTVLSAGILVMAQAVKQLSGISWEELARGLTGLAGILASIALFTAAMPDKELLSIAGSIVVMSVGIAALSGSLIALSKLTWNGIAKGLVSMAAGLTAVVIAVKSMNSSLTGAASLAIAAAGLIILAEAFEEFGEISWAELGMAVLSLTAALIGLVAAVSILTPLASGMLAVAGGLAALSVALGLFGAALAVLGIGFTSVAGSIAAFILSLKTAFSGIIEVVKLALDGIITLAPKIAEALIACIKAVLDSLQTIIPDLVNTILHILTEVIGSLAKYAGPIIDGLGEFIITVFQGLSKYLPRIIEEGVKLIGSALTAIFDSIANIDPDAMIKCIVAAGGFAALVAALSALLPLIPTAALGLVGFGALVAEFVAVLAIVGAIGEIPGIKYLMNGGAEIISTIGRCIGDFLGSIAKGFTDNLPDIADNLSLFMENLKPFLDGINNLDRKAVNNVGYLTAIIAALTATSFIDKIGNLLLGGNSLSEFGNELAKFGPKMREFTESISSIGTKDVTSAMNAIKILVELANEIPNTGGLISWFTGDNDLETFGKQLPKFGQSLSEFSKSVRNVDSEAVKKGAEAAKAIAEFAEDVPNTGGLISWFTGDNDLETFGKQLPAFGKGLANFSNAVKNINITAIKNASEAASYIVDMSKNISNSGGVISWFTGDNDVATFGKQLPVFGKGLANFSDSVKNVNNKSVQNASEAAGYIVDMAKNISNSGGVVSWFTGDNDLVTFAKQLPPFGKALAEFSKSVANVNSAKVKEAANASKALVDMTKNIANTGGMVSWFTGDNDLKTFGTQVASFGKSLAKFSDSVANVNSSKIKESSTATKYLVEMASHISNSGGMISWFTGDNDLTSFGEQLRSFGLSLAAYSAIVSVLDYSNIESAAKAVDVILEMGKNNANINLESFGDQLRNLGQDIAAFFRNINGLEKVKTDVIAQGIDKIQNVCTKFADTDSSSLLEVGESIKTAINNILTAAKEVLNLNMDDFKSIGTNMMISIANGIRQDQRSARDAAETAGVDIMTHMNKGINDQKGTISNSIKNMMNNISITIRNSSSSMRNAGVDIMKGFNSGIASVGPTINATIRNLCNGILTSARSISGQLQSIGSQLISGLARGMSSQVGTVNSTIRNVITSVVNYARSYTSMFRSAGTQLVVNLSNGMKSANYAVSNAARVLFNSAMNELRSKASSFNGIGRQFVQYLASGISSSNYLIGSAVRSATSSAASYARGYYSSMYNAGYYLVQGLANGIYGSAYSATYAASYVASQAAQAARRALRINSPSKVFAEIGKYIDLGLAKGIEDNSGIPEKSVENTADEITNNLRMALESVVLDELELDPVIKPVIDLSEVENSAGYINSKLGTKLAGSISSNMSVSEPQQTPIMSNNTNNIEIVNHFNITGDNAKDIANEVSRILQKQMERREAVWA